MNKHENIEIVPARYEHIENIKTSYVEFYSDSPINNTAKLDIDKLDNCISSMFGKNDFKLVAVDKSNGEVATFMHNRIISPYDMLNQKLHDVKPISTEL